MCKKSDAVTRSDVTVLTITILRRVTFIAEVTRSDAEVTRMGTVLFSSYRYSGLHCGQYTGRLLNLVQRLSVIIADIFDFSKKYI